MGSKFKFDLTDDVKLHLSGEKGYVVGRAEYLDSVPHYLVRYLAGDGRQVQDWQAETALEAAPEAAE